MNKLLMIAIPMMLVIAGSQQAVSQQQTQHYEVFHDEKSVGNMSVVKIGNDQNFTIKVTFNADIETFFKRVIVQGQEDAQFENGRLKSSSVFRKANGKVKVNKKTKRTDSGYVSFDGIAWHAIKTADIRSNLLTILFSEPANNQRVFSDNLEGVTKVTEVSDHVYQLPLLDGSFNTYSYRNGVCTMIKLSSKYATLILKRKGGK